MSDQSEASAREAVVDGLASALVARYPGRFSDEQVEQIRTQIRQLVEAGVRLRAFRLTNADEPEPIFHAVPREA